MQVFASHHRSAGLYYRHVCKHCGAPHVTRLCTQKAGAKYGSNLVNRKYSDRFIYNSSFVNTELLQSNFVGSMLSVCEYVKPNVSSAVVLKRKNMYSDRFFITLVL